jgi:TPR repeat protein
MNDAPACVSAGQAYEYAHGVVKDDARAAHFYTQACEMGYGGGCYNEAIMLENGRGVPRDLQRAAMLYRRTCTQGAKTACPKADELEKVIAHDAQ